MPNSLCEGNPFPDTLVRKSLLLTIEARLPLPQVFWSRCESFLDSVDTEAESLWEGNPFPDILDRMSLILKIEAGMPLPQEQPLPQKQPFPQEQPSFR